MIKRTFKIKEECGGCEDEKDCQKINIPRDEIYQSLANAKLYVFTVNCGMKLVEEEKCPPNRLRMYDT
jgi:hypothetical protein